MRLMQKVVLITGASTGFGRAAAELLARRGHQVFATMRDPSGRNATHRDELERLAIAENLALHVLELDVTDERSVTNAVDAALKIAGRIDVAINNAGLGTVGVAEAYTTEQWQRVLDVNLLGSVRVNRAVLPGMRKQRSGLLIHISSGSGRFVVPALAVYSASKFALEALADGYRFELKPFGIDSILIEPGIYRTEIFDRLMPPADKTRVADYGNDAGFVDRVHDMFKGALALPETPGPEVVADTLARLIEMDASSRPFRTVVSEPIQYMLNAYNAAAEELRPIIAQTFGVMDLVG